MYTHSTLWHNCGIQTATFQFTAADVLLISTAACHAAAFTGQLLASVQCRGNPCADPLAQPRPGGGCRSGTHRVTRVQMLACLAGRPGGAPGAPSLGLHLGQPAPGCTAGGDVVPVELHHRFRKTVGLEIDELYGMTEILSCIVNPPFGVKRAGSIGKPAVQTRIRIVDDRGCDVPVGQSANFWCRVRR